MTICFDMDGTIVDFYGVTNWLEKLRNYDATPYIDAKPLVNLSVLCRRLKALQNKGHKLVIISWSSKESNNEFDAVIDFAKKMWLRAHMPSITWDNIYIVPYGTNKAITANVCNKNDILFDDDQKNLKAWKDFGGSAYLPENIFEVLSEIS